MKIQNISHAVIQKSASKERTTGRLYKGANDTYTLVVEGQCPVVEGKYDPHGKEPNIDSVVDSLNDKFKK